MSTEDDWRASWAAAIVADPYSSENVESRLQDLLDGKTVLGATGFDKKNAKNILEGFVQNVNWSFKPSVFDDMWHAVFKIAKNLRCTERVRDATYLWTETYLLDEAWDACPSEEADKDHPVVDGEYDNSWIAASLGDARLFALGYGYSAFAWNALLDGLGLVGEETNSDSMRIGSCSQLLAAGQRLKLRIHGGGDNHETPGFAGRYLKAGPKKEIDLAQKEGEVFWNDIIKALEDQQSKSGAKAEALLKLTLKHLKSGSRDKTSVEVANIICPGQ
ncbi:hypothetical protein CVT25_013292 [Psilocybe cyanescens]|uniref:Uncharacterized protein n=1 Tax=Psilocybe cyanescens TaxID=93625 RepID=A0A409VXI9_PSICY|nr:hypothetical protein CVT25_013292 [Psilocybe cyanescens]